MKSMIAAAEQLPPILDPFEINIKPLKLIKPNLVVSPKRRHELGKARAGVIAPIPVPNRDNDNLSPTRANIGTTACHRLGEGPGEEGKQSLEKKTARWL